MRYFYEGSFANFKLAHRTYTRSNWRRRLRWHCWMWGLLACGLYVLIFASYHRGLSFSEKIAPVLVGGLIGGGVIFVSTYHWKLRRSYRLWNGDSTETKRYYLEVDGPVLVSGLEGRSEGRFQRSAIHEVVEDEQMLLLFVRKKMFLYFAKNSVPPEAFVEIRRWLGRAEIKTDAD